MLFFICFICVFLHWCLWAWNCQIAWDGLGAVFHTVSKTFRYARGLFMSQLRNQLRNQLKKQLRKQWCITYAINNVDKINDVLLMLLTIVFILSNNNYKFFPIIIINSFPPLIDDIINIIIIQLLYCNIIYGY